MLIVNDTAPPIKAAYPPIAVSKQKYISPPFSMPKVYYLGDIDENFKFAERNQTSNPDFSHPENGENVNRISIDDEKLERILDETLAEVSNEKVIFEENGEKTMNNLTDPLDDTEDIASRIGSANSENFAEDEDEPKPAPVILTGTYQVDDESAEDGDDGDALDGLSEDVRAAYRELEDRAEMEISRGVI